LIGNPGERKSHKFRNPETGKIPPKIENFQRKILKPQWRKTGIFNPGNDDG
jgi:hypothetical protein